MKIHDTDILSKLKYLQPDYQIEAVAIEATIDIDSRPVYSISTLLISVFEVITESSTKPFGQMESFDPLR